MNKKKIFALCIAIALFLLLNLAFRSCSVKEAYADDDILEEGEFKPVLIITSLSDAHIEAYDPVYLPEIDDTDAGLIAKTIYGEGRGLSKYDKSLIAWCILNRVDDERFPGTIKEVVTQPHQFYGYSVRHPLDPECLMIAKDVLTRYALEKETGFDYGRTLPKKYVSFYGDGKRNYFRTTDKKDKYDFSLPNPYKED